MKRLILLGVVLLGVVLSAQSAEQQKIDEFRAWLKALEPQLTPAGVTRARSIGTSLGNLIPEIKATNPPPPPPSYITQAVWDATVPGILARLTKLEGVKPQPDPDPIPPPPPPAESCGADGKGNGIDDDKDGQIDEGCVVLQPPSGDAHAYFDALCKTAGATCHSLRTQAQIDQYKFGAYAVKVGLDATAQAAKWSWVKDDLSAEQIRLPIVLQRPQAGTSSLLLVSDHRWDASWFTEFMANTSGARLDGWKWLQVTGNTAPGVTQQSIWFEPQMRWVGKDAGVLSYFGVRGYGIVRPPTVNTDTRVDGLRFGESIGPMLAAFKAKADTWTRIWIQITETAGHDYAKCSLWMADETQAPVQILKDAELSSSGLHTQFWIEYNTSSNVRVGGPMAAWARNVVALRDVSDVTPLLQRPVR